MGLYTGPEGKMRIDLDRASCILGTSKQMLRRWAQQGVIPCFEKGGEYEFDLNSIQTWAKKHGLRTKKEPSNKDNNNSKLSVNLYHSMQLGGVHFGLRGENIADLLESVLKVIPLPCQLNQKEVHKKLMDREHLASTGLGKGVAIPHPRHPLSNAPDCGLISTCFLESEIDYKAIDGQPVFVLFLMLSPTTKCHLQLLSQLSFCLHDKSFQSFLKKCNSAQSLFEKIKNMESKLKISLPNMS